MSWVDVRLACSDSHSRARSLFTVRAAISWASARGLGERVRRDARRAGAAAGRPRADGRPPEAQCVSCWRALPFPVTPGGCSACSMPTSGQTLPSTARTPSGPSRTPSCRRRRWRAWTPRAASWSATRCGTSRQPTGPASRRSRCALGRVRRGRAQGRRCHLGVRGPGRRADPPRPGRGPRQLSGTAGRVLRESRSGRPARAPVTRPDGERSCPGEQIWSVMPRPRHPASSSAPAAARAARTAAGRPASG